MINKISLVHIKKNKELENEYKQKLIDEYLYSCMTLDEFSKKYSISYKAVKYILGNNNIKKAFRKLSEEKKAIVVDKIRKTKELRYGDPNYSNPEKFRKTMIEKYGVERPSQLPGFKEKLIKTRNTNFPKNSQEYKNLINSTLSTRKEKYGSWSEFCKEKHKIIMENHPEVYAEANIKRTETLKSKFNVTNVSCLDSVKLKKEEKRKSFLENFEKENNCIQFKKLIEKYGQSWKRIIPSLKIFYNGNDAFVSRDDLPKISEWYSTQHTRYTSSKEEKDLLSYIKSVYGGEIIENTKKLIYPKELDIYIPAKNIAIEFNGSYWHSEISGKDKNYHLCKTKECEKLGIRLIHVFEYDWMYHRDIIKSIIATALGIYQEKIYARNCICQKINSSTYKEFLLTNHLQGPVNSSSRFGLYYNGRLVAVMGFGASRFKKEEYEMHRFCTALNTQVIGGFSKMIKYSNYNHFVSYIDRSLYSGSTYFKNGFKLICETNPSYFYCHPNLQKSFTRIQAQKHKLKNILEKFDERLSESDNMYMNGYHKIYDCGTLKVEYDKNN